MTQEIVAYNEFRGQLAELKANNAALVFDYANPLGNKAARSHVYKLRQTKAAVDKVRKAEKEASLERGRKVDAEAKEIMSEIEAMIDIHQKPLDEIEEREEQIRREAEERTRREAETRAQQEREAANRREVELQMEAERAARERDEANRRAEQAARETEERLAREAEERRQAEARETEKREKDRAHRAKVNSAAVEALVKGGMKPEAAKLAITLIAKGSVPRVSISY